MFQPIITSFFSFFLYILTKMMNHWLVAIVIVKVISLWLILLPRDIAGNENGSVPLMNIKVSKSAN